MSLPDQRQRMAAAIMQFEARRDAQGHLAVYNLPPDDGGGRYEVAGINEKYNKATVDALVDLIEKNKFSEAEALAIEFIAKETDIAASWTSCPAIESYLRDCVFNRGRNGCVRILQRALAIADSGQFDDATTAAERSAEKSPLKLLMKLRSAREQYERDVVKRDETSRFWKGLVNRWNNALETAKSFPLVSESANLAVPEDASNILDAPVSKGSISMPITKQKFPPENPLDLSNFFGPVLLDSDGMPTSAWESKNLTIVKCPWILSLSWDQSKTTSSIRCHVKIAQSLAEVLNEIWIKHNKSQQLIMAARLHLYGGSYEFRRKRGLADLSLHAYGAAVDFDPERNSLGAAWQAGNGMMSEVAIAAFKAAGWKWGGDFKGRKDPMHFQATS